MTGRRSRAPRLAAVALVFSMSAAATLAWAWTGGTDRLGLRPPDDPTVTTPGRPAPPVVPPPAVPPPAGTSAPTAPPPPASTGAPRPSTADPAPARPARPCRTGDRLVPTCGVLWGVAPGAFTDRRGRDALADFEHTTGRHQDVYHAYHRGTGQLFPTREEIAIAREPGRERILFLNWKPTGASWAAIARGDRRTDAFLDRLAAHIRHRFDEPFFFTVHHEAEDDVKEEAGSGYTARDYAAMYRHVVTRLRDHGVDNLVTVLVHLAYVPHTSQDWFARMYPGDDVVDWIGFDTYAYSDPGYGHGDLAELLNRRSAARPHWPGFYDWAVRRHPDKPLMVAEWGVWGSRRNPGHKAAFYRDVGQQIARFPRIKAMVAFDTPHDQDGRDSTVDSSADALAAYRRLGRLPVFQVELAHR